MSRLMQGDWLDREARYRCRSFVASAGVVYTMPLSRLLAAARRSPAAARRVLLDRQRPRVAAIEMAGCPTHRRFPPHAALARLDATDRIGSAFGSASARPWLRTFWGAEQCHLYMRNQFAALLAARMTRTPLDLAAVASVERLDGALSLALFVTHNPAALVRVEPVPAARTDGTRRPMHAEIYRRNDLERVRGRRIPSGTSR